MYISLHIYIYIYIYIYSFFVFFSLYLIYIDKDIIKEFIAVLASKLSFQNIFHFFKIHSLSRTFTVYLSIYKCMDYIFFLQRMYVYIFSLQTIFVLTLY